jgi:hypothetical protein
MFEIPICPAPDTGETRTLQYDEHGYAVLSGRDIRLPRRLEAVCYLVGTAARERMSQGHFVSSTLKVVTAPTVTPDASRSG